MTKHPRRAGRPWRVLLDRGRGPLGLLSACAMVAAAATFALDRYRAAEWEREIVAGRPAADRTLMPVPDIARWRPTLLAPGTGAPPFSLVEVRTGGRVSLDDCRGRPVVLLLGSFGCNVFCGQLGELLRLHDTCKDRADFFFVAIRDAGHPGPKTSPLAGDPDLGATTPAARLRLIRKGLGFYKVPFPTLLDEDGQVERAYDAYPQRLVIVGADGLVVFDGGWGSTGGPSDWDLEEVEKHLRAALRRGPLH